MELFVKSKRMKLLKDKIGDYLLDLEMVRGILNKMRKVLTIKIWIN